MTELFKVLNLSTGHVKQLDIQLFESDHGGLIAHSNEYGAWLYVDYDPDTFAEKVEDLNNSDYSNAVINCMIHARVNDCRYIQFDCDGDINPSLHVFDW